jgi:phosphatidylinositol alpha-1,6-mannosyltransferase
MKNILISTDYLPNTGGVAHYYANLVANFPGNLEVISETKHLLSKNGPIRWRQAISTILSTVCSGDNLIVGQILPLGTAAYLASYRRRFDYYLVLHGLDFSLATKNSWKRWLTRKIVKRSSGVICANSQTQKELLALYPNAHCATINPGLSSTEHEKLSEISNQLQKKYSLDDKIVLVSLGRLVRRKGFDTVILALKKIKESRPKIYRQLVYVICGDGPDRQYLEELAEKSEIPVIMVGAVSEEEKWGWLKASDIFLMPSRRIGEDYEGFGIVFLEAQSLSKAVIGAVSGGIADAIDDGLTGILCHPDDPADLGLKIILLSEDEGLRKKLGESGREAVSKKFAWPILAASFQDFVIKNKKYDIDSNTPI